MYLPVENMSDTARAFVFPCKAALSEKQQQLLSCKLEEFLDGWESHDQVLHGSYFIDKYTIVIFVDEVRHSPSGCAIDRLHKTLYALTEPLGIDCFYYKQILCLKDDKLHHYTNYNKVMKDWKAGLLENENITLRCSRGL